jgi:hypothetical protein
MRYISGMAALNVGDRSVTPGDWHRTSVDWEHPLVLDTETSPFGEYGIYESQVPLQEELVPEASHVRACLDLIEQGYYGAAQGMRENFISNEAFTPVILNAVWPLRGHDDWSEIDCFMGREYSMRWLNFTRAQKRANP